MLQLSDVSLGLGRNRPSPSTKDGQTLRHMLFSVSLTTPSLMSDTVVVVIVSEYLMGFGGSGTGRWVFF